jgi:opacity protein-like surface antigen
MRKFLLTTVSLAALLSPAFAADLVTKAKVPSWLPPSSCLSAGNCSGGYFEFGVSTDADLASTLTNGTANNGMGLNFGGGYQYWQGQVIAGLEGDIGYQFGTAGSTGTLTSTQFVKLGYNFFPSTATAAPAPSQNPLLGLVPANILANSTPSLLFGGAYAHGVEKGAAGFEIDTVIAAGWSTAFQYYNAPSVKGQADENVFRIMVQKHL